MDLSGMLAGQPRHITLRAATADDLAFLFQVYAGTRSAELALVDWTAAQKQAFLTRQFQAQQTHYHHHYPDAAYQLVLYHAAPVGRLYLDRRNDELHIIDIALLPEWRGQGIGSTLLRGILDEGTRLGLPVRLHVEHHNPAQRLYQRLGFQPVSEGDGIYLLMERLPG